MKRFYSTKGNRPTNRKRSKGLAQQRIFMLKNIKIAGTKPKLLAFNCVLLPRPNLTYKTLLCSLHAHKASSLREFFANKNETTFTPSKCFTTLRSPVAHSFYCGVFLFAKMQQGLTTMKRLCVFIYHCFLQVSLFLDVYKKQVTQKNNQATQL